MCNKLLAEDRFLRTLNIIHEANLNEYPLSACILYSTALETISSLIADEVKQKKTIDSKKIDNSNLLRKLSEVINQDPLLSIQVKEFLVEKKIKNIFKPTNINKLESPFKYFRIQLPEKFKKALKYRDIYLHGSLPKEMKLGSFISDNQNRAFELEFLVNVLTLKYVGYKGFLKNRSAEMEFYALMEKGINSNEIKIEHPLYYKI